MFKIELILGDCLDKIKDIPDGSIDLVLTDPPYGVTQNKRDKVVDLSELFRIGKRIILTTQQPYTTDIICNFRKYFKYDLVWDKVLVSGFLNANRMPLRKHESILIFGNGCYNPQFTEGKPLHSKGVAYKNKNPKNNNYGKFNNTDDNRAGSTLKYPTSIITFSKTHPSIAQHRTEKPVLLMEWLIKTYSNENDIVFDPFMGSGSTGVACKNLNRCFIGIEKDEKYFTIAENRIKGVKNE